MMAVPGERVSDEELEGYIVIDLGCLRSVVGAQWAVQRVQDCQRWGRFWQLTPEQEHFRFGDGERRTSEHSLQFEASFAGQLSVLRFSIVLGSCPPLFSRQGCSALGLDIKISNHVVNIPRLAVYRWRLNFRKQDTTS